MRTILTYRQPPVLMYHRLTSRTGEHPCSVALDRFREQLGRLRRLGYRSVSPTEIAGWIAQRVPPPPRVVAITFDDGYVDTLTVALPLLRDFGLRATCYVVTSAVGRLSSWTDPAPLLDWPAIREWVAAGMEVGSHSESHADLTALDPEAVTREVGRSKARLEDALGVEIRSFAYPYNRVDARVAAAVAAAGYAAGCAGVEIFCAPHAICRADAAHDSRWWFDLQLRPVYFALHNAYRAVIGRRAPVPPISGQDVELRQYAR